VTSLKRLFPRVFRRAGAGIVLMVLLSGRALLAQTIMLPRDASSSAEPRPGPTAQARPAAGARRASQPARVSLVPLIEALAQARFGEAEAELAKVRAASPQAAEPELLAAVLYGSRFVLEGSVDPRLVSKAKTSLETFRKRGGSRRAEEEWLSPALRALLGG